MLIILFRFQQMEYGNPQLHKDFQPARSCPACIQRLPAPLNVVSPSDRRPANTDLVFAGSLLQHFFVSYMSYLSRPFSLQFRDNFELSRYIGNSSLIT